MKQKLILTLKVCIFLSLGILLVWLAIKDVSEKDKDNIFNAFENANYKWIIISIVLAVISHLSRAMRWQILLEPLGHKPKLYNTFFAVMVGYLANYAPIPRLGEASRCGILTRYEKIPFAESFGTVIAERVLDLISLMIAFIVTFFVQYEQINTLAHKYIIDSASNKINHLIQNPTKLIVFMVVTIAILFVINKMSKKIQGGFLGKLKGIIAGFLTGLKTVKEIKKPYAFIFHSILIWVLYYVGMHVCFYAFTETSALGVKEGLAIFVLGTLGVVFTPGGLGAYHLIVKEVLLLFAISETISIAFPWIVWSSGFIMILAVGLISLVLLPLCNKEKEEKTI